MDFRELIQARRSVRAFEDRPVEETKLEAVLEAARAAPSAGNLQGYEIRIVRDPATRQNLARAAFGQDFVGAAPVVLVFFQHPARSAQKYGERGRTLYSLQDATIACAYAQLAAVEAGLATCWVGAYDDSRVSAAMHAPADLRPVAILPVGYAAEQPAPTPRRGLGDLAR
ncbi:MAG: nitroreductase family protein [Planctomycetes bacterium]|nr:nitroreductase family protein [Planctomycetota bacterium]